MTPKPLPGYGSFSRLDYEGGPLYLPTATLDLLRTEAGVPGMVKAQQMQAMMASFVSQYAQSLNRSIGRGLPKAGRYSYAYLLQLREQHPLAKAIIDARVQAMQRYASQYVTQLGKQLGWRLEHDNENESDFNSAKGSVKADKAAARQFVSQPYGGDLHPYHSNLEDVVGVITEQLLMYGRAVIVRVAGSYTVVDSSEIKPVAEVLNRELAKLNDSGRGISPDLLRMGNADQNAGAYLQAIVGSNTMVDLRDKAWVQEKDGMIYAAWRAEHVNVLSWQRAASAARAWYGYGPLEEAVEMLQDWLTIKRWNTANFDNNMPMQALVFPGMEAEGSWMNDLKDRLKQMNQGGRGMVMVGAPINYEAPDIINLGATNARDMEFRVWFDALTSLICSFFMTDPLQINLSSYNGGSVFNTQGTVTSTALRDQKDIGERGLAGRIANFFTRALVKPQWADLNFKFDTSVDDGQVLNQQAISYGQAGASFNSVMRLLNHPTNPDPRAEQLPFAIFMQALGLDLQQAMQPQPGADDAGGQPPDAAMQESQQDHETAMQESQQDHETAMQDSQQEHGVKIAKLKGKGKS